MEQKRKVSRFLALVLSMMLAVGYLPSVSVKADTQTVEKNIMEGLTPVSNVEIENPKAATDGVKGNSSSDSNNTKIIAGDEVGGDDNGYSGWNQVYLQYDFGQTYDIKEINLYRNTYENAVSTFKDVKVEVASEENFSDSKILYGNADYEETVENKGLPQNIALQESAQARYIRIWGKGHYIQNTNSSWKGYSNGVLFNEIEVIASVEEEVDPNPPVTPEPDPGTDDDLVDANILLGLSPISNSPHKMIVGGPTVPQVQIQNPECATDGIKSGSNDDSNNTKIIAGTEIGGADNGYSGWDWVYLQYDFGKERDVKQVNIYRNTYDAAVSDFKDVKVEVASSEDFSDSTVLYGGETGDDYVETVANKGQAQTIIPDSAVSARYIRIWGKGHYIQNTNSSWKGYSNGVLFNEIEVIAAIPKSEVPTPPPEEEAQNIALGKVPYVQGLTPTNIEAITDGKADDNYAVHNSTGQRWLQFEYRNTYMMKEIKFKLEEGTYKSINISVSSSPTSAGESVFKATNWTQGQDMNVVDLGDGKSGRYVRFTVNKDDNSPTKYSEVEIWATGKNYDESKAEYTAPDSKYNTLVWSDEFNGDTVDESKWNIIDGMANHGAIYNRGAVSIKKDGENSYLAINSKNYGTTDALIAAVGWDQYQDQKLGSHVTWSSGRVESKNKYSFQFGRMAVRAKVNDSQGIWPAIWMLCQDETGHDEIDVLEYLGQDAWDAWTTNHFGILNYNKGSHGISTRNYEAWSQDFHVYEVEWSPEIIKFYIDGVQVHSTTTARDDGRDGMHTRSMFPILETQVGAGWVGDVDYTKQNTKQDSDYLIDWVRVYQTEDQAVTRFDDLEALSGGKNTDYYISPISCTDGIMALSDGDAAYENKDNFYYGGQPRYETSRAAIKENAKEQSLIYKIPGVKDVHLTAYYQTLEGIRNDVGGDIKGASIRSSLSADSDLDFKIYTSADGKEWTQFTDVAVIDNFPEAYPSYARHTFDAYGLPEGTNYVKVEFPDYEGAQYTTASGQLKDVVNTDIQLAKVTFLQEKNVQIVEPELKLESIKITKAPDKTEYTEGEVFDPEGMEVKAVWSDGTETDITADVTYSTDSLKTTDEKVTIQYVYEETEATVDQAVTVKEKVIVDPGVKDEVTGVKIAPDTVQVKAGETQQFTVTVEGTEGISQEVTWEVMNGSSEKTRIDSNGKLTVGADETALELKVRAISKVNTEKAGIATVKVTKEDVQNPGTTNEKPSGTTGTKPGNTNTGQKPATGNKNNPAKTSGTTNTVKTTNTGKTVNTGDESPILFLSVLILLSAGCMGVIGLRKKVR